MIKEVVLLILLSVSIVSAQSFNILGEEISLVLLLPILLIGLVVLVFIGIFIKDQLTSKKEVPIPETNSSDVENVETNSVKKDENLEMPQVDHRSNFEYFKTQYKEMDAKDALHQLSNLVNEYLKDTFHLKDVFSYGELKNEIPQYGEVLFFTDELSQAMYENKKISSMSLERLFKRYEAVLNKYPCIVKEEKLTTWDKFKEVFAKKKVQKTIEINVEVPKPMVSYENAIGRMIKNGKHILNKQGVVNLIERGNKYIDKDILYAKKLYSRALIEFYQMPDSDSNLEKKIFGLYKNIESKEKDDSFSRISNKVLKTKPKHDKKIFLTIVKEIIDYFKVEEHLVAMKVYGFFHKLKRIEHGVLESVSNYISMKELKGEKLKAKQKYEEKLFQRNLHLLSEKIKKRKENSIRHSKIGVHDLHTYSTGPMRYVGKSEFNKGSNEERDLVKRLSNLYTYVHSNEDEISKKLPLYHRKLTETNSDITKIIAKDNSKSLQAFKKLFNEMKRYEEGFISTSLKYLKKRNEDFLSFEEKEFLSDLNLVLISIEDMEQETIQNLMDGIDEVSYRTHLFVDKYHLKNNRGLRKNEYNILKRAKKLNKFLESKHTRLSRLINMNRLSLTNKIKRINSLKNQTKIINKNGSKLNSSIKTYLNQRDLQKNHHLNFLDKLHGFFSGMKLNEDNTHLDNSAFRESVLRELDNVLEVIHNNQKEIYNKVYEALPNYIEQEEKSGRKLLTKWENSFVNFIYESNDTLKVSELLENDKTRTQVNNIFKKVRKSLELKHHSRLGLNDNELDLFNNLRRINVQQNEELMLGSVKSLRKMEEGIIEQLHPPNPNKSGKDIQRELESVRKFKSVHHDNIKPWDVDTIKRLHLIRKIKGYVNVLEGGINKLGLYERASIDDLKNFIDVIEDKSNEIKLKDKRLIKRFRYLLDSKNILDGSDLFSLSEKDYLNNTIRRHEVRDIVKLKKIIIPKPIIEIPKVKTVHKKLLKPKITKLKSVIKIKKLMISKIKKPAIRIKPKKRKLSKYESEEAMIKRRLARLEQHMDNLHKDKLEEPIHPLKPMQKYMDVVRKDEEIKEKWKRIHKLN